jgi:hypothetical protein
LARAVVTLKTERIKGSNPWCLWWWGECRLEAKDLCARSGVLLAYSIKIMGLWDEMLCSLIVM